MAGSDNTDVGSPNGVWVWQDMVDFDGEGRSFASSEQTLMDSWCCVAGVCDSGDGGYGDRRGGGGVKVMRDGWREMERGRKWCDEKDDEDDDEPPRYEDTDSHSPIPPPSARSRATNPNIHPRLNLRGGTGSKRLGNDERVPKVIWFLAGGVGRAPTGKGLREWKEKARKKEEDRTKKNVGFWGKLGFGMVRKGSKRKQKIEKESKGDAEGTEGAEGATGAEGAADGAQAADGGVMVGNVEGAAGDVAPEVSGGEAGAAPGDGEGAQAGEGNAQGGAASNSSGSGSGSGSSGSGSGNSGRAE